jgi:uncharacterized membrane protein YsdA (DUF1294 family)
VFPGWGEFGGLLLLINAFTYLVYWADKRRALNGEYRIPEKSLLLLALLGGSLGALIACRTLRHKTRKQPFRTLLIGIAALQIGAMGYWAFI